MIKFNLFARFADSKKQSLPASIAATDSKDVKTLSYEKQVVVVAHILESIHEQLRALSQDSSSHKYIEPAIEVAAFKEGLRRMVEQKDNAQINKHHSALDHTIGTLVRSMFDIFHRCPDTIPEALKGGIENLDTLRTQLGNAKAGLSEYLNDTAEMQEKTVSNSLPNKSG